MLAKDVINRTVYCRINFNTASDDLKDIREWVCEQFIEIVRNKYSHVVDLGTSDGLLNVFSKEIKDNSGAYNFLKKSSSEKYNERIGDDMLKWMADKPTFARAIARSISGDRGYTIVIAFDNVDRRERESQLSIFQTGQWFMDLTRSVCIMTLRDETFETYKDEKPLDAFLKTGNFYIRPPRFVDMVSKRLDLVIRDLSEKNIAGTHSYELAGIGTVKYPATSIGTYLTAVYVDLFRKKRKITLVLEGLSGRNARKSLEMFSAVLTSAHFDTKDFTSAALTYGSHHIQETTLLRALMRTNYLYFKPDHGFVRNIYDFPINSKNPNHFLKFELLLFLVDHRKKPGDVRFEGYFSVGYLVKLFVSRGFVDVDIIYTLNDMIFAELIVSENLTLKPLELRTAVRVRSSGYIHAKVLAHRAEYVSGCALVTPIGDRAYAERIGALWQITDPHTDARAQNKREAASCFAEYLEVQLQKRGDQVGIKETEQAGPLLIKFAKEALQFTPSSSTKEPRQPMADHEEQEFDRLFTE